MAFQDIEGLHAAVVSVPAFGGRPLILDADKLDWFLDEPRGWNVTTNGARRYVQRRSDFYRLHQILLPVGVGCVVDLMNRNTFDCRMANLRSASHRQNAANKRLQSNNTSGYMGVFWSKAAKRWTGQVHLENGRRKAIGCFAEPQHAAMVRDAIVSCLYGEFASLNFPDKLDIAREMAAPIIAEWRGRGDLP